MQLTIPPQPVPPLPFQPPEAAPRTPPQPPMVFVAPSWEYKHLYRVTNGEAAPLTEEELTSLGADGWELTGVIPAPSGVHLYFKRQVA